MSRSGWIAVAVIGIAALVVIVAGMLLLGGGEYRGWGGMGPGMMGSWGFGWIGGIMMLFMWLIPVGLIALVVLGVVFLVKVLDNNHGQAAPARVCPNCGRSVREEWRNCPNCGKELSS